MEMGIVEVLYFLAIYFPLLLCDFAHCFAIETDNNNTWAVKVEKF